MFFSPLRRAKPGGSGWRAALFVALAVLVYASAAFALPPHKLLLQSPTAALRGGVLSVNLSLTVDTEDGLRDLLKDGAVLELALAAHIEEERFWWTNKTLLEREFSSFIRHDPLSREFFVTLPSEMESPLEIRDRNLTRLLFATWRKLSLSLASLEDLRQESDAEQLLIVVNISLKHAEVPPWLEKSGVFWSSDLVPREQRTLRIALPSGSQ